MVSYCCYYSHQLTLVLRKLQTSPMVPKVIHNAGFFLLLNLLHSLSLRLCAFIPSVWSAPFPILLMAVLLSFFKCLCKYYFLRETFHLQYWPPLPSRSHGRQCRAWTGQKVLPEEVCWSKKAKWTCRIFLNLSRRSGLALCFFMCPLVDRFSEDLTSFPICGFTLTGIS